MIWDDSEQGFTLMELIVVVIIIAIMAAVAAPSLLGLLESARTRDALSALRGAMQEAQREAIKRSRSCVVNLDARGAFEPQITSDCFVTGPRTLKGVYLTYNNVSNRITFNYRGGITQMRTLVIYNANDNSVSRNNQKCLVISNAIGMIRSGNHNPPQNFNPTDTSTIDGNSNCVSTP